MESDPRTERKPDESAPEEKATQGGETTKLVRVLRSITINPTRGTYVDGRVVKFQYYNAFNYSLLSSAHEDLNLVLGITSPSKGEGKTLVACNLAVSLAMGSQSKTVLVDLNVQNPQIHRIFGVSPTPGLLEGLREGNLFISQTAIDYLSVLTAGLPDAFPVGLDEDSQTQQGTRTGVRGAFLGLEQLTAFRDILYTLQQEYQFIVVDMPAISTQGVPVLFANQLNGLLVVVDTTRTRREDIDAMFRSINKNQVLGFVYNHYKE